MPAFQNTLDKILEGCENYFAFLDNKLIATKGKVSEHEEALDEILRKTRQRRTSNKPIEIQIC